MHEDRHPHEEDAHHVHVATKTVTTTRVHIAPNHTNRMAIHVGSVLTLYYILWYCCVACTVVGVHHHVMCTILYAASWLYGYIFIFLLLSTKKP